MTTYKLGTPDPLDGKPVNCVIRTDEDGSQHAIPFSEDNTDYQQYLKWLEEGNQPLPADE